MSLRSFRMTRVVPLCLMAALGLWFAQGAGAQSVWQQMKDEAKKAKEQMKQGAHPQQGTQAAQPGQQLPNRKGQQAGQVASPTPQGGDAAGPFHPPKGTKVEETILAPLAPGARFFISPHGVHVATFENAGSRAVIYYDGQPGPKFDEILGGMSNMPTEANIAFSPDGKRYAYCGRSGDQVLVMVDGKELFKITESLEGRFNGSSCTLGFTSNGEHVFVISGVVRSTSKGEMFTRFYWDGKAAPLPNASGVQSSGVADGIHAVFSPDGDHYAYVAVDPADERKWALVVDGKVAPYLGGEPQWSADSQHLYTVLHTPVPGRGQVAEAKLDGKPFLRADEIKLHLAPKGSMVVAEVYANSNTPRPLKFLVIDGKKVPGSEIVNQRGVNFDQVTFSADGKHYAARFTNAQGQQYVFVDGKAGQQYQSIDHLAFTSEPAKITYTAFTNSKPYVIFGEQESNACSGLFSPIVETHGGLTAGPPGGHAGTLCGLTGGAPNLFIDGKTLPLPEGAEGASDLRFSPDGQHYVYIAGLHGGGHRLVIDGKVQMNSNPPLSVAAAMSYVFSPDGQHIAAYSAPPTATGQYASGLFLDGKYIPTAATPSFYRLEFTRDGQHIAWAQPVPSEHAFRVFVDGKAVAQADDSVDANSKEAWWDMAPDGTLSILGQDANNLKRITITPSPETSVATMGGGGITVAQKESQ